MLQIALVTNEHDHNVRISVITKLLQPSGDVDIGLMFCDVIDEQSSDSTTVVSKRSPVSDLAKNTWKLHTRR